MAKKGQVEFIILLGILVVVAVVIIVALQSPGPGPVTPETRTVKESVESFIRAGAFETMKIMGEQGGYVIPAANSVDFLGSKVAYWQKDGQLNLPDLRNNFVSGLQQYISDNKDSLANSFDKSVTLGDPQVNANILSNKIDLTVNLPTTVDGSPLQQPYIVSIPSKLGDIFEFSSGFVTANNQDRYFETFTLSSMVISPFDEGVQKVPTYVQLIQCGQYVFKTWWDIQPDMQDLIEKTLANTYMPGKAPTDFMTKTSHPKFLLTPVNGKDYSDIEVGFYLPDDFELTRSNFDFNPSTINAFAKPIPMTSICMSEPLYVNYFVRYPNIVRIEDPLTQNTFQFAIDVYIKDNEPGVWSDGAAGYASTDQTQLCNNPMCSMKIEVKDSSGNPIPYASATFMGCPVGRGEADGVIESSIPCGIGNLQVYRQGYDITEQMFSSDLLLADHSVTMLRTPVVNLHFYEVVIDTVEATSEYWIKQGAIRPIDNNLRDGTLHLTILEQGTSDSHQFMFDESVGSLIGVSAGSHIFSASLFNNFGTESVSVIGMMATQFTVREDMDGKDLHVYVPYYPELNSMTDNTELGVKVATLSQLFEKCGIGPISETMINDDFTCSLSFAEAGEGIA